MKLLMFLASHFAFRPFEKTWPGGGEGSAVEAAEAVVVFIHNEPQDEASPSDLETKFVKNVKWIAGKRGFKNVVLHSFTHLAETSASPEFARNFIENAAARLQNTGYQVMVTPFGWVGAWDLSVYGESLAKVFKSL
jgi:hypothetical protein